MIRHSMIRHFKNRQVEQALYPPPHILEFFFPLPGSMLHRVQVTIQSIGSILTPYTAKYSAPFPLVFVLTTCKLFLFICPFDQLDLIVFPSSLKAVSSKSSVLCSKQRILSTPHCPCCIICLSMCFSPSSGCEMSTNLNSFFSFI